MYDYRSNKCNHHGQYMSMMNMPMENMHMMNMAMMNMPMYDENDEDLKSMYPKIYIRIYPFVKYHYDMIVSKHGKMYCPTADEMDSMCKDIHDKYKEHYKDEDHEDYDDMRQDEYRYYGGGGLGNLGRILLIGSLIGGRY